MNKKLTISITALVAVFIVGILYLGLYHNDYFGENKSLNTKVVSIIESEEDKKLDFLSLNKNISFDWDEVYLIAPYEEVGTFFENRDTYVPKKTYTCEVDEVYMLAFTKYSEELGRNKVIEYTYIPIKYIDCEKLRDREIDGNYYYERDNSI